MDDENGAYEPDEEPVIGAPTEELPPDYEPPESATPSVYVYRGSLLALVLGSFVALAEVLFAAAFAWALLGQVPSPTQFLGGTLILAGVVAVRLDEA